MKEIKNHYGFRVDINNPKIRPVYERYKKWKGLPTQYPISDDERREFEAYILGEKKDDRTAGNEDREGKPGSVCFYEHRG